jgi:hypothetical protein
MIGWSVEGTEIANGSTCICVVDVAINVVGTKRLGMHSHRYSVRGGTDCRQVVGLQQREAFFGSESVTSNSFIKQ